MYEFIRVHDDELVRDEDGVVAHYQPCPSCGRMMHISSLHCTNCGVDVAWGCDPFGEVCRYCPIQNE